jgi:hypothetical protein
MSSKFDHMSPKDWCSDASVARVNLHSCWLLGWQHAVTHIPGAGDIFKQLLAEGTPNINMLSPLGTLLVNQHDQEYEGEDQGKDDNPCDSPNDFNPEEPGLNTSCMPLSHTHKGDVEDVIADEMPRNNVDSSIIMQGLKTSKAKALCY